MPIRLKILLGALALTVVTGVFGVYSRVADQRLAQLSFRLYDDAFMAMSYLRAAQNGLVTLSTEPLDSAAVAEIAGNLGVARQRAMSERGRAAAAALIVEIGQLKPGLPPSPASITALRGEFDDAVEVFAGDAFRFRREVGILLQQTNRGGLVALGASGCMALLITLLLTQSIVPQVREAVRIAQAIAGGHLENIIVPRGRSETAQLLRALCTMQVAITGSLDHIKTLMDEEARHHADAVQQQAKADALLRSFGAAICGVFRRVSADSDRVGATATRLTESAQEIVRNGREAEDLLSHSVGKISVSSSATRSLSEALRAIGREAMQSEAGALTTLAETASAGDRMRQTREAASDIEHMVAVISNIAGQTRMLALNATIEAARAGGTGQQGFSAVAGEIKNLAQQSRSAADTVALRAARIVEAVDVASQCIEVIDASAHQVHALSASIAASVSQEDQAAELLWSMMRDISANSVQVKAGVEAALRITADSARGINDIGDYAFQLARDTAQLSVEVTDFLDVVGSIQSGEAINTVGLDCAATLTLGGVQHAGRVVRGSDVMIHFLPVIAVEPGAPGTLQLERLPGQFDIRVAGCEGGVTLLQPSLARETRLRLQAGLTSLAA